jgi:hypothetical protein
MTNQKSMTDNRLPFIPMSLRSSFQSSTMALPANRSYVREHPLALIEAAIRVCQDDNDDLSPLLLSSSSSSLSSISVLPTSFSSTSWDKRSSKRYVLDNRHFLRPANTRNWLSPSAAYSKDISLLVLTAMQNDNLI